MDMRKLVGTNIRNARIAKDMTQEELAERSGFSQQYISGLERGRRNPTIVSIYELGQALGVTHEQLVAVPRDQQITYGLPEQVNDNFSKA
ncbi:MAG: helix-turn-helix transcriptional regulator [Alphaproteobacteria bacterium]|nr:helix-turn-helix transcriptional regulator [Alphaproteobacteria bacterium]